MANLGFNKETLNNNLTVCVDWLAFTVLDGTPADVISFLGYRDVDFDMLPKGGLGYRSVYKLQGHDLRVYFDGSEGMGVHVTISGKAIPFMLESYRSTLVVNTPWGDAFDLWPTDSLLVRFLSELKIQARITRMDLAVDDIGGRFFTIDEVLDLLEEDRCISKFRSYRNVLDKKMDGRKQGHTVYFGSRTSQVFLRLYDKKLEQNVGLKEGDIDYVREDWYRWELELKDERAQQAADLIIRREGLGQVVTGILTNYIRFVELDDSNKSRCTVMCKWQEFVDAVSPLRLFVRKVIKTLRDKESWIIKQCLPTIAGVFLAHGGTFDFLADRVEDGIQRMGRDMREILRLESPAFAV